MEQIRIKYIRDIKPLVGFEKGDFIDLRCAEDTILEVGEKKLIPLGVAMELPKGYFAEVVPRSSTFSKYGIIMTNSIGIIDESYCGDNDEWRFPALALYPNDFKNGKTCCYIPKNERIAQFRIVKKQPKIEFIRVEELGNEDRGGIGSTGRI